MLESGPAPKTSLPSPSTGKPVPEEASDSSETGLACAEMIVAPGLESSLANKPGAVPVKHFVWEVVLYVM